MLTAKPRDCGLFSFLVRVESGTYAALIEPLRNVVCISSVNASGNTWMLNHVWNRTMDRNETPGDYYYVINNGNTFVGYGDEQRLFFVYQRRGRPEQACVDFGETSNVSPSTGVKVPTLETLKTINTGVDLESVDIQQSIQHTRDEVA